jgi:ligand-binding sensor domain-containing protein/two-component sensor histidine kinase
MLALALLVVCLPRLAHAERLPIKIYTTADGLPSNNINKIVRDSRGFLWFCTAEGLSLFDGHTFVNFGVDDGLPHANVNDILESAPGEYWVATQGGLCRFKPGNYSDQQHRLSSGEDLRPFRSRLFEVVAPTDDDTFSRTSTVLLQSRDGTVWCGTGNGLFQVQRIENRVGLIKVDIGLAPNQNPFITTLLEDRQRSLWVGTAKDLHRRWPDGSVAHYGKQQGLADDNIHDLLEDRQGNLWIGTRLGGLIELSPNTTKDFPSISRIHNRRKGLETDWVFDLYETSDGRVLVGTNRGLVEFSADEKRRDAPAHIYTRQNGFSYHEITNVSEDRDGNLWLGTVNGAMKVAREGFVTFNEQDGVYSSNSLFESANGELYYFGYQISRQKSSPEAAKEIASNSSDTFYAAIGRFDGDNGQGFSWVMPQLGSARLSWSDKPFILRDHAGEWWIGTTDGIYVFPTVRDFSELQAARPRAIYTTKDGLAASVVFSLYEDSRGDIWISTTSSDGNGLSRWERSSKTLRNMAGTEGLPSLKDVLPVSFQEDRAGNMWIGFSQRGIARYKDGRFTQIGSENGLPAGRVNDLLLDQQGRLWIATSRGGLSRIEEPDSNNPQPHNYGSAEGLSSNQVSAITEDSYGRIYVATGRGLDQLTPATGRVKHYTTADGLAAGQIMSAFRDRSGMLWFGTIQGLSRLEPRPAKHTLAPAIFIKGLRVGGEKQPVSPLGEKVLALREISPNRNEIQIDFMGISFASGQRLEYQYKLEGTGQDWSPATDQATINFVSLAAGNYRLLVRAIDSEGVISPVPASVNFTVLRPFWLRWWFVLLAALTVALMSYGVYRYRLSRLLELERVRTRIASDLHDEIGSNLSLIAMISDVASRKVRQADSQVEAWLALIASTSRETVDSMSDIVWAVNPNKDHVNDLTRRMRQVADDIFTANEIPFRFSAPDAEHDIKIGAETRREVFMIFKEAVNNIARHSNCTQAEIKFLIEHNWLTLRLSDDGQGFKVSTASEGNGLASMQRRATNLSGKLEISATSRGTTVFLRAPIDRRS